MDGLDNHSMGYEAHEVQAVNNTPTEAKEEDNDGAAKSIKHPSNYATPAEENVLHTFLKFFETYRLQNSGNQALQDNIQYNHAMSPFCLQSKPITLFLLGQACQCTREPIRHRMKNKISSRFQIVSTRIVSTHPLLKFVLNSCSTKKNQILLNFFCYLVNQCLPICTD
ncbi:hypothetical protein RJ639_001422 [Escallonia herrerae]|uniref:Uncharacterized protein n=1 Tax=Escallonia herrerae TaxID=1293975 RepID=A0AA88XFC8_9ASTE|nr:hypothetical protein RJ639_001422 [Escallonia herrerae]